MHTHTKCLPGNNADIDIEDSEEAALLRNSSVALCPIQVTMTQHDVNFTSLMSKQSIVTEGSETKPILSNSLSTREAAS